MNGPVAQLVEQLTFNQWVAGSNPAGLTTFNYFLLYICDYNFMDTNLNLAKIIKPIEKILLGVIAVLTVIAVFQEIYSIYINGKVQLADLLLLFIYTEVLGMIGIFYVSNKIPITLPLFIAMTAIARLIILQGKGMDPIILIYEAGAIFIIALACLVIRYKPKNSYVYQSEDENASTTLVHNKINKE